MYARIFLALTCLLCLACNSLNDDYSRGYPDDPYYERDRYRNDSYYDRRDAYYQNERERRRLDRERRDLEREREHLERKRNEHHDHGHSNKPKKPKKEDRCPRGFSPSEKKCSNKERRKGCKDMRTETGLGCVSSGFR